MTEEQSWVLVDRVASILPGPPPLWNETGRLAWEQLVLDAARALLRRLGYRAVREAMDWDAFVGDHGDDCPMRGLVLRVALLVGKPQARPGWHERWRRGDVPVATMSTPGWTIRYAAGTSGRGPAGKSGTVFRANRHAPCVTVPSSALVGPASAARLPQRLR